jgi:hypothetical protein
MQGTASELQRRVIQKWSDVSENTQPISCEVEQETKKESIRSRQQN